jgi:photosystem II stability/assembly factor-like uncharacterized protein
MPSIPMRSRHARISAPVLALMLLTTPGCDAPVADAAPSTAPAFTTTNQVSGTDALLIGISPVDDRVVWISGARGTWLRTVDGGATWEVGQVPGADSLQFRDVHAIDEDTAWLLSIGNGSQSRIYRTIDGGETWALQFMGDDPRGFYDCFDFWDERRGIVIGDEVDGEVSMLATYDGGETWSAVPSGRLPVAQPGEGSFAASGTCLVAGSEGRAWAVASNPDYGRLLRTIDYGESWSVDTLPLTVRAGVGPQSVSFRDDSHGMVLQGGADSRPTDVGAAYSADGGHTWTPRTRPPLTVGVWGATYVPGSDPPTLVAVSPSGAALTTDEGLTWSTIDANDYWTVGFASPDAGWAVGRNGRITKLSGF